MPNSRLKAHEDHRREWREFDYAYPVLSRRSKGISLGLTSIQIRSVILIVFIVK